LTLKSNQISSIKELAEYCVRNGAVFPSMEAFEMRVEIPVVWIIFYDYFLKASVGDARWRKLCMMDDSEDVPLGTVQCESFAMLLLRNNYFAWLLIAKQQLQELITDYCPEPRRRGKLSAAQAWMENVEIDINGGPGDPLLVKEDHDKYNDLAKITEQALKRAATKAKHNEIYKEVVKTQRDIAMGTMADMVANEEEGLDDKEVKMANVRRKRKYLKPLREYTVHRGDEGKFKGWLTRAVEDMRRLNSELNEKSIKCAKLRAAYKELYRNRHRETNKKKKTNDGPLVDYSDVWGLPTAGILEI
jgi:hypothetical protein